MTGICLVKGRVKMNLQYEEAVSKINSLNEKLEEIRVSL